MSAPSVYAAIHAITAELSGKGIPKSRTNHIEDYKYRSIDDVLDRLAPLLAAHRLCVLPRVVEREMLDRTDEQGRLLVHVALRVCFTLTSVDDGTSHLVEAYGEALDSGDKATAKAMSGAYKTAMIQTFCIPVCGAEEPDRSTYRLGSKGHGPEPLQGWSQWCLDIEDIISLCESAQAISSVQERNRDLLKALGREQPQLYAQLGQAFTARREALASRPSTAAASKRRGRTQVKLGGTSKTPAASQQAEVEHA